MKIPIKRKERKSTYSRCRKVFLWLPMFGGGRGKPITDIVWLETAYLYEIYHSDSLEHNAYWTRYFVDKEYYDAWKAKEAES